MVMGKILRLSKTSKFLTDDNLIDRLNTQSIQTQADRFTKDPQSDHHCGHDEYHSFHRDLAI